MRPLWMTVVAVFAAVGTVACAAETPKLNCGLASLSAVADAVDRYLDAGQIRDLAAEYPDDSMSLAQIVKAGGIVGMRLEAVEATLDELREVRGPAVLHLKNPDHFLTSVIIAGNQVLIRDATEVKVIRLEDLAARYSGRAAILVQETEGPRFSVDDLEWLADGITPGTGVTHAFTVTNRGDAPLSLRISQSTCGCLKGEVDPEVLPPGERGEVRLSVAADDRRGRVETVTLRTNDSFHPRISLSLRVGGPAVIKTVPANVLATLMKGQTLGRRVLVQGPDSLKVSRVECPGGIAKAVAFEEPRSNGTSQWVVRLQFRDDLPVGTSDDVLRIELEEPDAPPLSVPVRVRVLGDLVFRPSSFFFVNLPVGESQTQKLAVYLRNGSPMQVIKVESDLPGVELTAAPESGSNGWAVVCRMTGIQAGSLAGLVTVTTDVTGEETLRVPLWARVVEEEGVSAAPEK